MFDEIISALNPVIKLLSPCPACVAFAIRSVRDGTKAAPQLIPGLQLKSQTSPFLGGEGYGAGGDDPLPAHQLGKYEHIQDALAIKLASSMYKGIFSKGDLVSAKSPNHPDQSVLTKRVWKRHHTRCNAINIIFSLCSATEWEERRDDNQCVHESGMSMKTFIFITEPRCDSSQTCCVTPALNGAVTFYNHSFCLGLSLFVTAVYECTSTSVGLTVKGLSKAREAQSRLYFSLSVFFFFNPAAFPPFPPINPSNGQTTGWHGTLQNMTTSKCWEFLPIKCGVLTSTS